MQEFLSHRNSCKKFLWKRQKIRIPETPSKTTFLWKIPPENTGKKRNPQESFFLLFLSPKNKFLSNRNRQPRTLVTGILYQLHSMLVLYSRVLIHNYLHLHSSTLVIRLLPFYSSVLVHCCNLLGYYHACNYSRKKMSILVHNTV